MLYRKLMSMQSTIDELQQRQHEVDQEVQMTERQIRVGTSRTYILWLKEVL